MRGESIMLKMAVDAGQGGVALTLYIEKNGETGLNGYIFTSRKGENKPITRQRAWQVINEAQG